MTDDISSDKLSLKGGELLVSKLNPRKGIVLVSEMKKLPVVCSSEFISLVPKAISLRFAFYLYSSELLRQRVSSKVQSATYSHQRAKPRDITKLWIDLPSDREQEEIADFLDRETARIDGIVEKENKLIELLKEKRSALITRAVTKGLDPNVKMKPSGMEWIGEMPATWQVKRMKFLLASPLKYGANEAATFEERNWPRYIRITDFDENGTLREDTFKSLPPEIAVDYMLEDGDILFARSGATVGKSFQFRQIDGKACFAGYLIKATPNRAVILSEFLFALTKSLLYENWKNSIFIQATIENIAAAKYKELLISFPSLEEQRKIVEFIKLEGDTIDGQISRIEKQIGLLKEYKLSLITAAVTGKIDVRGENNA